MRAPATVTPAPISSANEQGGPARRDGRPVLAELDVSDLEPGDWREQLRATARSFRAVLVAHPAAIPLFMSRPLSTPNALRAANAVLGILRRAGFSAEEAATAYQQVVRYLLGLVKLESASPGRGAEADAAAGQLDAVREERLPYLAEAAPYLARPADPARALESGLDLLVAGLDRLLA